jgi:hypothetical protein
MDGVIIGPLQADRKQDASFCRYLRPSVIDSGTLCCVSRAREAVGAGDVEDQSALGRTCVSLADLVVHTDGMILPTYLCKLL